MNGNKCLATEWRDFEEKGRFTDGHFCLEVPLEPIRTEEICKGAQWPPLYFEIYINLALNK